MNPMICESLAPPEVAEMLHELSVDEEANEFMQRTLHVAERDEKWRISNADSKPNNRTLALMFMMQSRMTGEATREALLTGTNIVSELSAENDEDLTNWSGISLAMFFASDWLLEKMIAKIPPAVRSTIIAQMPPEQHQCARSMFTT